MRSVIATIAIVMLLVLLVGTVFVYSGAYYVGADQPHWGITTWLLSEARTRSIRAHASGITVPADLDDPVKIVAGVTHFAEHCVVCHGAPGVERDDIAEGLSPRPPNLADTVRFYKPGELFWIVKHGIRMTGMPAWGDHSDDELWAVVAFLQELTELSAPDYAKLIAVSRAQGVHHQDSHEAQPQSEPTQPPVGRDRDHPAGHQQ